MREPRPKPLVHPLAVATAFTVSLMALGAAAHAQNGAGGDVGEPRIDAPSPSGLPIQPIEPIDDDAFDRDDPQYGIELRFDEELDDFIVARQPEPGTPEGDLEIARRRVIQGEPGNGRGDLEDWLRRHRRHPMADVALFYIGESYLLEQKYFRAHEIYVEFLNNFAGSRLFDAVLQREIVVARAFLAGEKRMFLGIIPLSQESEAIEILASVEGFAAGTTLEETAIKVQADYFFEEGEFPLAEDAYARLARRFPNGRYHRLALVQAANSAMASFTGTDFDVTPLIRADERFRELLIRYPAYARARKVELVLERISELRAEKRFKVGQWYEKVDRPRAARYYYALVLREHPDSPFAEQAASQLRQLRAEARGEDGPPPPVELDLPPGESTQTEPPSDQPAPPPAQPEGAAGPRTSDPAGPPAGP